MNLEGQAESQPNFRQSEKTVNIPVKAGLVTVLYGRHDQKLNLSGLPSNLDGMVIEAVCNWTAQPQDIPVLLKRSVDYCQLMGILEGRQVPAYLLDIGFNPQIIDSRTDTATISTPVFASGLLGTASLAGLWADYRKNGVSRRRFLKTGLGIVAGYGLLPFVPAAALGISQNIHWGESVAYELIKFSNRIHPADFLYRSRNTLVAYKMQSIMESTGRDVHFGAVWGNLHQGFNEIITCTQQEKLDYLQLVSPILRHLVQPETFYQGVSYRYQNSLWQVDKIINWPELEALVC